MHIFLLCEIELLEYIQNIEYSFKRGVKVLWQPKIVCANPYIVHVLVDFAWIMCNYVNLKHFYAFNSTKWNSWVFLCVHGEDVNKNCDKKALDNLEQTFGNLCVVYTRIKQMIVTQGVNSSLGS